MAAATPVREWTEKRAHARHGVWEAVALERLLWRLEWEAERARKEFKRPPKRERPRCGAKTRKGTPCQAPAVWLPGEPAPRNGRCRLHGGLSTGPKTPEGKARIAEANRRRARERRTSGTQDRREP